MTLSTPLSLDCPPRFSSPRTSRSTFGGNVAEVAAALGTPLMPWQRHVVDVALEVDESGRFVYDQVVLTVPRQAGKALDVNTDILTANRGWVRMGDLVVGDEVFHPDGHTTRVVGAFPVMHGHECFRVTTTDGRSVVADADHLWTVTDKCAPISRGPRSARVRSFATRTLTTREMFTEGVSRYRSGARTSSLNGATYRTNEYRFVLPQQGVLKAPDVDLPIDPYLFGAWLGDGSSASAALTCSQEDVAHWVDAIKQAGYIPTPRRNDTCWTVGITTERGEGRHSRSFGGKLRRLGVLGDKHVPAAYLLAGTSQRLALLQGLMDTDGTIDLRRSQASFCSTNRNLAESALFLARSLGWRATLREGRAKIAGRDCGEKFTVAFTPKLIDGEPPFRLPRKLARVREADGGKGRMTVSIAKIEPVESVPVRCIKVDSPDGLFLAGRDLVATHNTTLLLALMTWRLIGTTERQHVTYAAQSGVAARDKLFDDYWPALSDSPLGRLFTARKTSGHEAIMAATGSRLTITAATEKAGHGGSLDLPVIDEAFAYVDARLEQALLPAMRARRRFLPGPQLWIVSTAGNASSTYLKGKVDAGRESVNAGRDSGTAYFEWSADMDADPNDPATWWSCIPSMGYTVDEDAIRAEHETYVDESEWRRAGLNQWLSTVAEPVIDPATWLALADAESQIDGPVVFSVDVAPDRSTSAICAAGQRADGRSHLEVIDHKSGTGWVVERLSGLIDRHGGEVVIDPGAPVGSLIPELEREGVPLRLMRTRDVVQGCGQLFDAAVNDRLRHLGDGALSDAIAGAQKREVSGGGWAWSRRSIAVDITPLVAATNALWGAGTSGESPDYDVSLSVF